MWEIAQQLFEIGWLILVILSYVLLPTLLACGALCMVLLAREIVHRDPSLWREYRALSNRLGTSETSLERLNRFLRDKEYLRYDSRWVAALAAGFRFFRAGTSGAVVLASIVQAWGLIASGNVLAFLFFGTVISSLLLGWQLREKFRAAMRALALAGDSRLSLIAPKSPEPLSLVGIACFYFGARKALRNELLADDLAAPSREALDRLRHSMAVLEIAVVSSVLTFALLVASDSR